MAKLEWDRIADRVYETGIDRGVFYVPNPDGVYDNGVAWNGLTNVEESFDNDKTRPHYFDGTKYLDSYDVGDYSATLSAFTYPDEFLEFEGLGALGGGLYADDQRSLMFGLSYRTLIGQELESLPSDYQIHLLYNLTAVPSTLNYQNGSDLQMVDFSWELNSIPETAENYRPTSHIILDSRYLADDILSILEDIVYGTDDTEPRLPNLPLLVDLILGWAPKLIQPNPVTGLAPLVAGVGDLTQIRPPGIFYALPTTRLVKTPTAGLYALEVV